MARNKTSSPTEIEALAPMDITKVKKVAIYPAIGIARVGNSPDDYFVGPTIPGVAASDENDFRDKKGRIKRQAAKFYVYGLDAKGNILGELNESHGVKVDWRVDVANKKSAWYNFDIALDIPAAAGEYDIDGNATPGGLPVLSQKRNREFVTDAQRKLLMIEATAQNITGRKTNANGKKYHFEGAIGETRIPVFLGELRTDSEGRLLFLGGLGKSASFNGKPLSTFANNEGWHDDTSDGPVDATVKMPDGSVLQAEGAWVLTAPTNFAVGVQAFSTGYDLLNDHVQAGNSSVKQPSFYQDIYPTLKHLTINQWVNAGVSREFGWGSAYEFDNDLLLARLNSKCKENRPFRQTIFESFRNPNYKEIESGAWPPLYGDAVTFNVDSTDPRNWYAVTEMQYTNLQKWAQGKFIEDEPLVIKAWNQMTPCEQANGLTESALEETLGGPFHPGCEFTWPMRHKMMFSKTPFRIKRRKKAKEDFGVALSPDIALAKGGPLDGSTAGDLTKWMAVPWQSDTSSCLSAYRAYAGEYLPTFWPARVPNDVFTSENYALIKDTKISNEKKIEAFSPDSRKKWLRGFIFNDDGSFKGGTSIDARLAGVTKFTKEWYKIGIILKKPLPTDPALFPEEVWVETGRQIKPDGTATSVGASKLKNASLQDSSARPAWVDMNPRKLR
jgi:hypothetical protein